MGTNVMVNYSAVAEHLRSIAKFEPNIYKKRAYYRAADSLESINYEIDDYKEIPGIGVSLEKTIKEFIETGTSTKYKEKSANIINPTVKTKTKRTGKNESVFYSKDDLLRLAPIFKKANALNLKYEICGSIRRGKEFFKDVDILVLKEEMHEWHDIVRVGRITVSGEAILDCIIEGIPVNLRAVNSNEWGAGLLFLTGSKLFNIFLRNQARKFGYRLNQYSLHTVDGEIVAQETEEEIFKALNLKYYKPEERNL